MTTADQDAKTFSMKTSDGQEFQVRLTSTTYMEVLRNLGEEVAAGFQQALHGSSRVLANGTPYLTGTERLKGSHSMSGYHSFELCYLAAVYTNLLIKKQPMDFYFKPQPGAFKDNVLRVQPDILPQGSVCIEAVWINDEPCSDFDPVAMTVNLPTMQEQHPLQQRPGWASNPSLSPAAEREMKVRVRLAPTGTQFDCVLDMNDGVASLTLYGALSDQSEPEFKAQLDKIVSAHPKRVLLRLENLQTMSKTSARALGFACERLDLDEDIYLVGANAEVKKTLQSVDVLEECTILDSYDAAQRAKLN